MIVTLKTASTPTLDQLRAFLDGSQPFELHIPDRAQAYAFIAETLRTLRDRQIKRPDKGLVRRYLVKVTGFSRQQLTRLIGQYHAQGGLQDHRQQPPAKPFTTRYTPADILALAESTARCPAKPPRSSASAPSRFTQTPAMHAWPESPTVICTTCARRPSIVASAWPSARPGR